MIVGEERHDTIDMALRYLGLGNCRSRKVPVDDEGRIKLEGLAEASRRPVVVPPMSCLQAGTCTAAGTTRWGTR